MRARSCPARRAPPPRRPRRSRRRACGWAARRRRSPRSPWRSCSADRRRRYIRRQHERSAHRRLPRPPRGPRTQAAPAGRRAVAWRLASERAAAEAEARAAEAEARPAEAPPAAEPPYEGGITVKAGPFAEPSSVSAFRRSLAELTGAREVYLRGYEGGRAVLEVELDAPEGQPPGP